MTFSSLFGERLKKTRKALGLSQAEVAEVVGVSREYWGRCERGASIPGGEVLAALAERGADVRYILTGQEPEPPAEVAQTAEEVTMLRCFRAADPVTQRAALGALLTSTPANALVSGMNMSNLGDGNVQIGSIGGSYSAVPPKPSPRKKTKRLD